MNLKTIIHPFLFAVIPAIFLWSHNFSEVFLWEVVATLFVMIALGGLVFVISWLIYRRDLNKGAILASAVLFFTLYYQFIKAFVYKAGILVNNVLSFLPFLFSYEYFYYYILFLAAIVIIIVWYKLLKTEKDLTIFNKILTIVAGVFILISFIQIGTKLISNNKQNRLTQTQNTYIDQMMRKMTIKDSGVNSRDVYYIILDGYTNPAVLEDILEFENSSEMVNSLSNRGFTVLEEAKSNYAATHHSLPSSLNMKYIALNEAKNTKLLGRMLENNLLKEFFLTQGYNFIHAGANWPFTYFNKYAKENINLGFLSPYQTEVWNTTIFARLTRPFGVLDSRLIEWKRIQHQLTELANIASREEPTFVFAHMLIPHSPYVFNSDGSFVTSQESAKKGYIKGYLDQIEYINKEIIKMVDIILEKSERKPIIIIQADHGIHLHVEPEIMKRKSLDYNETKKLAVRILNVFYLPDNGQNILHEGITPVNTFRVILNYYFDQNLELLEDKSYMIDDRDNPSQFISL